VKRAWWHWGFQWRRRWQSHADTRKCQGRPRPAGTAPATLGLAGVMGERRKARITNRKGGQDRSHQGGPKPHLAGAGVWPAIGQSRAAAWWRSLGSGARGDENGGESDRVDRSVDRADLVWLDQRTDQAGMGRLGQVSFGLLASRSQPSSG
jgi:hypothetical protein